MSNGLVNSCALTSRNGTVVDDVNTAPTAIVGGVDTGLAVRVLHARIDDLLSLLDG